MSRSRKPLAGLLVLALLAIAFCIWTALGNDVNLCVTAGCTMYADFAIAGISMWWFGVAAFSAIAVCAILGLTGIGRFLSGFFLFCDIGLLFLMALTAPCVNCLLVAVFFALCYFFFRRQAQAQPRQNQQIMPLPSLLLWAWVILFIVNVGQVARSQIGVWPILDESGDPVTKMFFSPSCAYCIDGINALSGNVNTAFYPVAENDEDVARINNMMAFIHEGESIAQALASSREARFGSFWEAWSPALIVLRFRLLCNKSHLFAQGSQSVPYFEHKGLLPGLRAKESAARGRNLPAEPRERTEYISSSGGDPSLPFELQEATQCGGRVPCPPAGQSVN